MFPEGTDKSDRTTQRSKEFAAKQNLPQLEHLLHPSLYDFVIVTEDVGTTGFVHLLKLVRKHNLTDVVYDITVGYKPYVAQGEKAFFTGLPPGKYLCTQLLTFKSFIAT